MTKYKTSLILVFICFVTFNCRTIEPSINKACLDEINNFFSQIQSGNYQKALENLLLSNKAINSYDSTTVKLKNQFNLINEESGRYIGYRIIRKRIIENDVAIYSCLVKYKLKFYRFNFTFYNAEGEIKIYKFAYDDTMDTELEESLKLYIQ